MADVDLAELLRGALSAIESKQAQAELEELKGRRFTLAEFRSAIDEAPDDEREQFFDWFAEKYSKGEAEALEEKLDGQPPAPEPEPRAEVEAPEPKASKKVRPGRKPGRLYDWHWDEDTQSVVRLDIPRVYSGSEEPDEVEYEVRESA